MLTSRERDLTTESALAPVGIGELIFRSRNDATDELTMNPGRAIFRGSFVSASNREGLRAFRLSAVGRDQHAVYGTHSHAEEGFATRGSTPEMLVQHASTNTDLGDLSVEPSDHGDIGIETSPPSPAWF